MRASLPLRPLETKSRPLGRRPPPPIPHAVRSPAKGAPTVLIEPEAPGGVHSGSEGSGHLIASLALPRPVMVCGFKASVLCLEHQ